MKLFKTETIQVQPRALEFTVKLRGIKVERELKKKKIIFFIQISNFNSNVFIQIFTHVQKKAEKKKYEKNLYCALLQF